MDYQIIKIGWMVLLIELLNLSACQHSEKYAPETYLQPAEKELFLNKIIRYTAKLPKGVSHTQKFEHTYDTYYQEEVKKYVLQHYFISPDSTHYFLITRPAPSLYEKRVATGGYLKYDQTGNIAVYEEVFRTWKMKKDKLDKKSQILFASMVEKGNVDDYLPDKTQEDWVEFPDAKNYFDTKSRQWKFIGQNDSLVYLR